MKKILLLSVLILSVNLLSYSQCTVQNVAIQLKSINTINGKCEVVFDFSWEQEINMGNKFAIVHLWRTDQYPDLAANGLAYLPNSNVPDPVDLADALATIIIMENHEPDPYLGSEYVPYPTVPVLNTPGMSIVKENIDASWDRMSINNIRLTIPNCSGVSITGDIWASQSDKFQTSGCVSSNISAIIGNPRIAGILKCTTPRAYNMSITNVGDADIVVTYKIFVDEGDKIYEPTVHDILAATYSTPITITAGTSYAVLDQGYPPYDGLKPYSDHGIWIEVSVAGFPNKAIYFLNNLCAPLPVTFSSFTATRDRDRVNLRWVTATELNNAGFEIQRMIGRDQYRFVALVPSRAADGNSAIQLSYSYSDVNPTSGTSLYRLKQIDIDGRTALSPERMVAGNGKELQVYPNPVQGGSFNVVLENYVEGYDISLFDNYGRLVNRWYNVRQPELMINRPRSGMYTIQAMNLTSREVRSAKILVLDQ